MERQKQSTVRRFFASRSFLLISLLVAILIAFGFARAYYQDYRVRQEIKSLQDEVKHLEKKKFESMELLKYVASQAFVEEKARTELNLKKPGEQVIFINDATRQEKINQSENQDVDEQALNNYKKWWYYFIHKNL